MFIKRCVDCFRPRFSRFTLVSLCAVGLLVLLSTFPRTLLMNAGNYRPDVSIDTTVTPNPRAEVRTDMKGNPTSSLTFLSDARRAINSVQKYVISKLHNSSLRLQHINSTPASRSKHTTDRSLNTPTQTTLPTTSQDAGEDFTTFTDDDVLGSDNSSRSTGVDDVSNMTSTARRGRKVVNPHDFRYIHQSADVCRGREVELVLGAPTSADNFRGRKTIRETWGQYAKNPEHRTALLFFLGRPRTKFFQTRIDQESETFGDIVQEDFLDTYRNLSLKSVALMKWVSESCPNSTFVLKADDDMYINVPRLLKDLRAQYQRTRTFIMGQSHARSAVIRDKKNKWYVALSHYPGRYFPHYMSGCAYSLTTSAAKRIYQESLYVPDFFLEDVYLTGMLAQRTSVPLINNWKFNGQKIAPNGCNYQKRISGHKNSMDEIRKIHKELQDPNIVCYFQNGRK
ncbi:beta-1,3-galactosyltransferase 1 [Aplysia californica]|uniref:Hexosyltransferase n=1 Tax=Aplysia californica TaxID=6500 RepID=A0ABM1A9T0_APLCA|nr:beta-1,3-galactosyltransferase 1 [Aplysia californica]